jgi:hypothetical protein
VPAFSDNCHFDLLKGMNFEEIKKNDESRAGTVAPTGCPLIQFSGNRFQFV